MTQRRAGRWRSCAIRATRWRRRSSWGPRRGGASYLGVGPTFASQTKQFDQFPGLDFVAAVAGLTALPAFAIGGVTPKNVASVVKAGLKRVAVGQAITKADDPQAVAKAIRA